LHITGALDGRRLLVTLLAPMLFILALATKETAVSLPLILLLWESSRNRGEREGAYLRLTPSIAILLGAGLIVLATPMYGSRLVPDLHLRAIGANLLSQFSALNYLLVRLFVIHPLDIDPELRPTTALSGWVILQGTALLAVFGLAVYWVRRRPWLGFGIAWFFVVLLPTNSLLPRVDLANDRQIYLASVGPYLAAATEWALYAQRFAAGRHWHRGIVAAILVVLASFTLLRNLDYLSEIRLWQQTARVSPLKPRVMNNLGFAYSAAGCFAQAEAAYLRALQLDPAYALARQNLSSMRWRRDHEPETAGEKRGIECAMD
jgi:tetratricopeptide (TPR) repeat protein